MLEKLGKIGLEILGLLLSYRGTSIGGGVTIPRIFDLYYGFAYLARSNANLFLDYLLMKKFGLCC